jgi:hypothetical protein
MTSTPLLQSLITAAPVRRRYPAGNAGAQPRATISPAFRPQTQIARRDITLSVRTRGDRHHPRSARAAAFANPASNNQIKPGR